MKLYKYETNIKNNWGIISHLVGRSKQELQKYFKDLGVVIGKRISQIGEVSDVYTSYLETQKQLLLKYLKLKKLYIDKGDKQNDK